MIYSPGLYGTFCLGQKTAAADTAFLALIPPRTLNGTAVAAYQQPSSSNPPAWWAGQVGFTHISYLVYTTGNTAHALEIWRPLNFTYASTAVAANNATLVLYDNPGTYSTNYKYPKTSSSQYPADLADNNIAANDYVAAQLTDGSWFFSKITTNTSLTLTLTTSTPNVTGGGIAAGTPVFWFGAPGDSDPATGVAQFKTTTTVNTSRTAIFSADLGGFNSLHPGDPLLFYSPNVTGAGTLDFCAGYYAKF